MATQSHSKRLTERIDAVMAKHKPPIEYRVRLVFIEDDGSLTDSTGAPHVSAPGAIVLGFDDEMRR